jgi:hypothetical protein
MVGNYLGQLCPSNSSSSSSSSGLGTNPHGEGAAAAAASFLAGAFLTEIHLCNVCSCHVERPLRRRGRRWPGGFDCVASPVVALARANRGGQTSYTQGCDVDCTDTSGFEAALAAARAAVSRLFLRVHWVAVPKAVRARGANVGRGGAGAGDRAAHRVRVPRPDADRPAVGAAQAGRARGAAGQARRDLPAVSAPCSVIIMVVACCD